MDILMQSLTSGNLTPYTIVIGLMIIIIWKWGGKILDKLPNVKKKKKESEIFEKITKTLDELIEQSINSNDKVNELVDCVVKSIEKNSQNNEDMKKNNDEMKREITNLSKEIINSSKENRDNISQQTNLIISFMQNIGGGKNV